MNESDYSTFGRTIYPGREVRISCRFDVGEIGGEAPFARFRIAYLKEGHGILENGDKTQIVASPAVICLNRNDIARFRPSGEAKFDVMFFDPTCFERYVDFPSYDAWEGQLGQDQYFFRSFFERSDAYIGVNPASRVLGNRIDQLITLTHKTLDAQADDYWPCRSRSFFIELLLTVNSIHCEGESEQKIFGGKLPDDVARIVEWANEHYLEKIVLDDMAKTFNTNRTSLNQKFKAVMGTTVIDYVIDLRMQIARSLLRKTYLTVSEIMERSGYRDDAHFLRAFKKHSGCTPGEYRKRFEERP